MFSYLAIVDDSLKHYGTRGALIFRGSTGFYITREEHRRDKVSFLHLGKKLAEVDASEKDILEAYLSHREIPASEHRMFRIGTIRTPIGIRYGRIQRPVQGFGSFYENKIDDDELEATIDLYNQLDAFMHRFSEIARVLQPSQENFNAYGYEIRSLLILACTEVEMLFKRMIWLKPEEFRGSMPLFFKSSSVSGLPDFRVKFSFYRDIGEVWPFSRWSGAANYIPLPWYQAYNSTKHNRHSGLKTANFKSLVESLAACSIILKASTPLMSSYEKENPALVNFNSNFIFVNRPQWTNEDHYWRIAGRSLRVVPVPGTMDARM